MPRHYLVQFRAPYLSLPLLSILSPSLDLGGVGGGISVLIRFYKNVLILCTITILCKDDICVQFKIFME